MNKDFNWGSYEEIEKEREIVLRWLNEEIRLSEEIFEEYGEEEDDRKLYKSFIIVRDFIKDCGE